MSKIISFILNVLLTIVTIIIIIGMYYIYQLKIEKNDYANLFGYTFFEVATGSMSPTMEIGDVVIVKITKEVNNLGINNSYNFVIPVYENMPVFTETEPNLEYKEIDELVTVNVTGTLRMRNSPSGNQTIGWLNGGDIVTRVEKAESKVNGTYWDKIKSQSGICGYVARETYENSQEYKLYLTPVEEEKPEESIPDETIKPEENIPEDTVKPDSPIPDEDLTPEKPEIPTPDEEAGIQPPNQEEIQPEDEVVEVKIGDVNNDGKISPTDYVLIKNHIMQIKLLQTDNEKKAADVNKDGKISPTDYVLIKNHIMLGTEI